MSTNKKALVTGYSHGIGKAIAIALAKSGYDVGINYCGNREGAEDTLRIIRENGGTAAIFHGDVGNYRSLEQMFRNFIDEFGTIDLLVNNAGVSEFHPILETTEAEWDHITDIDWKGTYFGTQFAAREMVRAGHGGVVINMASNHVDGCFPEANVYAPSKAAVDTFTKNAAMELAPHGIRVVAVAPGYTNVWTLDNPVQAARARIPLKRFAEPEEIAEIIVFLASDKCAYMTGTRVTVDGGALLPVVPENALETTSILDPAKKDKL